MQVGAAAGQSRQRANVLVPANRDGLAPSCYTADEIDAIAAYCHELNRCFYLPGARAVGRSGVHLRVRSSLNNQDRGVNWADDYAFERLQSDTQGAVAQLGERRHGMAEARGSSPLGST